MVAGWLVEAGGDWAVRGTSIFMIMQFVRILMISGYYQKLRVFVKDLNCSVICLYLFVYYWAVKSLRSY